MLNGAFGFWDALLSQGSSKIPLGGMQGIANAGARKLGSTGLSAGLRASADKWLGRSDSEIEQALKTGQITMQQYDYITMVKASKEQSRLAENQAIMQKAIGQMDQGMSAASGVDLRVPDMSQPQNLMIQPGQAGWRPTPVATMEDIIARLMGGARG